MLDGGVPGAYQVSAAERSLRFAGNVENVVARLAGGQAAFHLGYQPGSTPAHVVARGLFDAPVRHRYAEAAVLNGAGGRHGRVFDGMGAADGEGIDLVVVEAGGSAGAGLDDAGAVFHDDLAGAGAAVAA